MENTKKVSVMVGLMVITGVTLFVLMAFILARVQFGDEGFHLKVRFNFLNNLGEGAPVRVSGGLPVGFVERIYQKDLKTYVDIYLEDSLREKIPKSADTRFAIYTTGLMGQKYINITIPSPADIKEETEAVQNAGDNSNEETEKSLQSQIEYYQDGDVVMGIDPPSIDQMMLAFSSWFGGKNGGQVLAEIMQETRKFIGNLNSIAVENRSDIRLTIRQARESFTSLSEQLEILLTKLNVLSKNFTEISKHNKNDIKIMLKNMSRISRDLNLITTRINSGRGSVGKFISDEELYVNANEAVGHARDLFKLLKKKPWLIMYKEN